jgi:ferric-dicitrate binding protein FerR (iron transport regulator)
MGAILGVLGAICAPVFAHHGGAAYDMSKPIILKGAVVTQFLWINPHPLIKADYKDEKGEVQHWTMEMGSTPASELIGWTRTTLKPGDVVTLYVWQAKTHLTVGRFNKVVLADGSTMRDTQTGADDGRRADTGVGR